MLLEGIITTSCPFAAVMLTDARLNVPGPLFLMTISIMPLSVATLTVITLPSSVKLTELLAPPKIVFHTPVRATDPATTSAISKIVANIVDNPPLRCDLSSIRGVARLPLKLNNFSL